MWVQTSLFQDLERWPHQVACLAECQAFLASTKRDFFVEMATGTGKSLVMADLLASLDLSQGKACIIVPKLDLMEQLADVLEELLPFRISRVGTGWPADLSAEVFVCVRNSAWQLQKLTFDLQILDESHHYEPITPGAAGNVTIDGVHAMQVLGLDAKKRIFFSATLQRNKPDFEFGLRPAIDAGIISDYSVMVPVLTAGDPRPGLVEIIQNLPMSRKILAFCNTVDEAKNFTQLLNSMGIPADHYNGHTSKAQRQQILRSFARSQTRGGIRVLVTVDVLSEGVDLPCADTCLFVAARHHVRLRQCVGRVLRKHSGKIDALVIAPPLVVQDVAGAVVEDMELGRLLLELAQADHLLSTSLRQNLRDESINSRIYAYTTGLLGSSDILEEAGRLLHLHIYPSLFKTHSIEWELGLHKFAAYKVEHGDVMVPNSFKTPDGYNLGTWVQTQRSNKAKGKLSQERVDRLTKLGIVWDVLAEAWELGFGKLAVYKLQHGDTIVPKGFKTADGYNLGTWVQTQRSNKAKGKLSQERVDRLTKLGIVWDVLAEAWELGFSKLAVYKLQHGDTIVPKGFKTADDYSLGTWVDRQRQMKVKGKLSQERVDRLTELGMVWDVLAEAWELGLRKLAAYKVEHGDTMVPKGFKTADGYSLDTWVDWQRQMKVKGKLSQERVDRLTELGMVWDVLAEAWELGFHKMAVYKLQYGDAMVPTGFKTGDGFCLGAWVNRQRKKKVKGKLSQERVDRLTKLGMVWDVLAESWEIGFSKLAAYKVEHGDVMVPQGFKTPDGYNLGTWVQTQRSNKAKGKLSQERVDRLTKLGIVWDVLAEAWELGFSKLAVYKLQHGDTIVPKGFKTADGYSLGTWVKSQRRKNAKGKLSQERVDRLTALGVPAAVLNCGTAFGTLCVSELPGQPKKCPQPASEMKKLKIKAFHGVSSHVQGFD